MSDAINDATDRLYEVFRKAICKTERERTLQQCIKAQCPDYCGRMNEDSHIYPPQRGDDGSWSHYTQERMYFPCRAALLHDLARQEETE